MTRIESRYESTIPVLSDEGGDFFAYPLLPVSAQPDAELLRWVFWAA